MTDEPYTPDRGAVRYRYVDGDYSGGNRDPHAEFDRFVAKIKADALREFVSDAQDSLNCSGDTRWMARALARADLIEGEA